MSYEAELAFAKALARQAGDIMLSHFKIGVATTTKDDNSPLTVADTAINDLVISEIKKAFPDHAVRGEEASFDLEGAEYTWVCDPIDGTTMYSFGMAINVFALVLVREGQPVMSVVYDPYLDRLFWAGKGEGAYLGDQRLHVHNKQLGDSYVAPGGKSSSIVDSIAFHSKTEQAARRILLLGSSVYEGLLVAAGQLGAHVYLHAHPHDVAPTKLFVEEAGGRVTDLNGNDQSYDQPVRGLIASNGIVHDELLAIVKKSLL